MGQGETEAEGNAGRNTGRRGGAGGGFSTGLRGTREMEGGQLAPEVRPASLSPALRARRGSDRRGSVPPTLPGSCGGVRTRA